MNAPPRRFWTLSEPVAAEVERLIASGQVRDLDELVQIALGVLGDEPEHDAETLRRAVQPAIETIEHDPSRAIPLDQAWAELQDRIARRRGQG
jgi:Arc/MetJ-type ribon-helix-helix transcriptional regulator